MEWKRKIRKGKEGGDEEVSDKGDGRKWMIVMRRRGSKRMTGMRMVERNLYDRDKKGGDEVDDGDEEKGEEVDDGEEEDEEDGRTWMIGMGRARTKWMRRVGRMWMMRMRRDQRMS